MKTIFALAACAVLLVSVESGSEAVAGPGVTKAGHQGWQRPRRRPVVIPSSERYPGGRCGQLNLERARLYGLCR